ncbi:MAG: PD-(D/E)XK nuclease family protein [Halioglobus sp.]|nr:PD-(D/E)XK nuclease family protein [Halioglobus sp.]
MTRRLYDIGPLEPLIKAGFVLLTPNQRLARRIKSEWDARCAAAGARVWEPIPVLPLESWLERQWQQAVSTGLLPALIQINEAQAMQLWQQVIAQDERESGQYHLLRPAAAAEVASDARNALLRWQVDTRDPAIRQQFSLEVDCGRFLRWLDLFERRLQVAGQATALDCIARLARCAGHLAPSRVALLAFDDIAPLYRAAVDALAREVQEIAPGGAPARQLLYDFPDKRAELQAVARWAATTSRRDPAASLGIVLGDMAAERAALEFLLRREFDCLGGSYTSLPVNFSTGIALDRAPLVRDALGALALAAGPRTAIGDVEALLHSRFLRLPDGGTALANCFIRRLYDAGREKVEIAELRHAAGEVALGQSRGLLLGQYLLALAAMRELRRPALPSRWAERFCQILSVWGWPGSGPLDSLEYQQLELWYRMLDEYRAYDAVCQPLDFGAALLLLRNSCRNKMSQPATADCNVQVLGPLEAAGLGFDQLWLCGMQADRWPAPARPNPFIPQLLQRRLNMPHASAQREWNFAVALMDQFTRSAGVLHASYCRLLDDVPQLPSALLEGFAQAQEEAVAAIDPAWTRQRAGRLLETLDDQLAPALEQAELSSISGGSALLEDQSQCPFRAYAKRRLGVEPLPSASLALSAADRGALLHEALNALWAQLVDQRSLLALGAVEETVVVEAAAQHAITAFPARRRRLLGPAYWRLEAQRMASLLREWLALERQRGEFLVMQREQDISLDLGGLPLGLRVDRVDQLPDGSRVIIDYKSGVGKVQDWLGERPAKPQLLLYAVAAPGAAAALAFAQVRPRESRFVGLGRIAAAPGISAELGKAARDYIDDADWEALNAYWRSNLERLAAEFVAGRAGVDPLTKASCNWCGLQPLCRIGSPVDSEEEVQ